MLDLVRENGATIENPTIYWRYWLYEAGGGGAATEPPDGL